MSLLPKQATGWLFFIVLFLLFQLPLQAAELLGADEGEVSAWAKDKGYTVNDSNRGTAGCREGKRYVELVKGDLKVYALFFQPQYQEHSSKVTLVEFAPSSPVSQGQARQWAIQVAPIVGTRPGTHKQQMSPGTGKCDAPHGGFEERYTGDFLVEYHYGPGGSGIQRLLVSNEGVR